MTFGWDTRGNQTGKGTSSFVYDSANRLTSANTGGNAATYTYNGEGVRVGKTVNGASTAYLQDVVGGLPHVLVETTGSQQTLYVYGLGLAWQVDPDGTHRYYHADSLGSTRVVTDDAGSPVSTYSYDAYGAVRAQAGEMGSFTYTGEQTDTESSLVFLRARSYDAQTGRLLQKDALLGKNAYVYGLANPVRYTDPNGLDPLDSEWEQHFAQAHGGRAPSLEDRLDRLVSYYTSKSTGLDWTDADWQQYGEAKENGAYSYECWLAGTSGDDLQTMTERIQVANALLTLKFSGSVGRSIYQSFVGGGGKVRFGGMAVPIPFWQSVPRQDDASIGWGNVVFLTPVLKSEDSEFIAAHISHEIVHATKGVWRWPWTRTEEMEAFDQEARVWEGGLSTTYKGSRGGEMDLLITAANTPGGLKSYVERFKDLYMQFPYRD